MVALAASTAVLALLSGCDTPSPGVRVQSTASSTLPSLSLHGRLIEPSEILYRDGAHTWRPAHRHVQLTSAALGDTGRLSLRVVSAHPAQTLWVGTFDRADDDGLPVDGGDQFDCFADSACTVTTRAGSAHISVPVARSVRLVIVREVFMLSRGTALEMLWRFRVAAP